MKDKKIVELIELEQSKRWEYLKRYYEVTSKFYDIKDEVVSDEEIDECIKNFKKKPSPKIRKEIKLNEWNFILDEKNEGMRDEYYSPLVFF